MIKVTSRGIVMKLICCMALVVIASAVTFSQTPKSGALLTITSTPPDNSVNLKIYDSQIHSGTVQAVPPCTAANRIPTDAYVLQGGSATGCDPGDAFEVTENNSSGSRQDFGLKTNFSGFRIETHYLSEPTVSISAAAFDSESGNTTYTYTVTLGADIVANEKIVITDMAVPGNNGTFTITSVGSGTFTVSNANGANSTGQTGTGTVSNAVCNTAKTICASPDSGFLTVTNNTGSDFSGTISLTGASTGCGSASDSFTGTLANSTGSVTLALGTPGSVGAPTEIDSSNCGGFNQPQTLSLSPNVTKTASFGKDDYQITTLNSLSGDTLDVLPVPVPAGPLGSGTFGPFPSGCVSPNCTFQSDDFGTETPSLPSPLRFSAGSSFAPTKYACVPYADFSADKNPVCVELQITPNNADSYFYTVQNDFDIDGFSLSGIGGPAFLGKHMVLCPRNPGDFDQNIFFQYTAASVTFGDPLKGGGSGGGSCWVVAFDPSVAPYTDTVHPLSSFSGFSGLLSPPALNPVNRAQAVPLNFTFPTAGLHLCASVNNSGSTCTAAPALTSWAAFGTFPIDCTSRLVIPNAPETSLAAGGSSLQTISSTSSLTSYRFNWKPQKTAPLNGCVVVVTQFSSGLVVFPADFKYTK